MKSKPLSMMCLGLIVLGLFAVSGSRAADPEMVKLELDLPTKMFTGTPKDIKSPNLEPPREGKRPPLMVPKGTARLSAGKSVTGSDPFPVIGELEFITDEDKAGTEGSYVELGPGQQYVQIDLEKKCDIHAVVVWHYHSQGRAYRDVIVQTANDPDFIVDVKTIFNNDHDNSAGLGVGDDYEYIETNEGKLIGTKDIQARYLRLYSNGNTSDELNHYTEVEVFGQPAE